MHARRHRKTSPEPTTNDRDGAGLTTTISSSSATLIPTGGDPSKVEKAPTSSGRLRSYLATARRRWSSSRPPLEPVDSSTLLPTTYSSPAKSQRRPRPTAKNCNNFLMGGHYYPGKDKKRRTMRRKTLWYKIFCSSPPRKLFSAFCVLYILVWHVLSPMTDLLVDLAKGLVVRPNVQNPMGDWLQYDTSLKVPSIEEERSEVIHSVSMRARIKYGREKRHDSYLKLLEEITPIWYHRNDPVDKRASSKSKPNSHPKEKQKKGPQNRKEYAGEQNVNEHKKAQKPKDVPKQTGTHDKKSPQEVSDQSLPFRTLATMDSVASEHTSCPQQPSDSSNVQTTLIIQTSIERLWILKETCKRWLDPIVVVVFIPSKTDQTQQKALDDFISSACEQIQIVKYLATDDESQPGRYPVNRLRNAGLDAVQTSHIMITDVDFLPSANLHEKIRSTIQKYSAGESLGKRPALIVPAFERKPPEPCESEAGCSKYLQGDSSFIPSTFDELHHCFERQDCIVFQSDVNWEGHFSTNSKSWLDKKWYTDDKEAKLRSLECFHTARYEPYVVIEWCPQQSSASSSSVAPLAPHYDERFYGYGKNKIEYISHLRSLGYHFSVLPEGFITHNPHPESKVKELWNNVKDNDLHKSMDKLYPDFLKELEIKYKHLADSIVNVCPRHKA